MKGNIIILNHGNDSNRGVQALLHSKISLIRVINPKSKIFVFSYWPQFYEIYDRNIILVGSVFYDLSQKIYPYQERIRAKFLINYCKFLSLLSLIKIPITPFLFYKKLKVIYNADLIITNGGDDMSEDYTGPWLPLITLEIPIIFKKDVVPFGESIGPFAKQKNIKLVKNILPKVKKIAVREKISHKIVRELIGIKNLTLIPDTAFYLKPNFSKRVNDIIISNNLENQDLIIGISLSKLISRYGKWYTEKNKNYQKYCEIFSNVINKLINEYNAKVIFIPHVMEKGNDDREAFDDIFNFIDKKEKIVYSKEKLSVEELKALISKCNYFIGSRMHANIAALSSNVPTLAISYGIKTEGIVGECIGLPDCILNINNGFDENEIINKFNYLVKNGSSIRKKLEMVNTRYKRRLEEFMRAIMEGANG